MKFPFGVGGAVAGSLLAASFLTFAPVSIAEPLQANIDQETPRTTESKAINTVVNSNGVVEKENKATATGVDNSTEKLTTANTTVVDDVPPPFTFSATAYSLYGRMASGANVKKGVIAADRKVLPIGTRVKLEAGNYTGEYEVCDTGGAIKGKRIDVWVPSTREANRFGRRTVKLTVLSYPKGKAPKAAKKATGH